MSVVVFQTLSTWPALYEEFLIFLPPIASSVVRTIICSPETRPPHFYYMPLSAVLVVLGEAAIAIQKQSNVATVTVNPYRWKAQACTIDFALSFLVLSRCEPYQLYFEARGFNLSVAALLETLIYANIDHEFEESRDAFTYYHPPLLESQALPPLNGWASADMIKVILLGPLVFMLYYVGSRCLNYPVKRLANPEPADKNFHKFGGRDLFFTSYDPWLIFLGIVLQRRVRLLNRMLFWWCVEWFEGVWSRWR